MDVTINRRDLFKGALAAAVTQASGAPVRGYLKPVQSHLEKIITQGTDVYGPVKTPMWMASLDTKTGRYPDKPYAAIGQRVYREIASPKGSSLYWDQPQLVAAYAMTGLTGDPRFKDAVDAYVKSFLERGIDEHGLFQWGNHRYYDAYTDKFVGFSGSPHEIRPLTPAWEIFWRLAPEATEREIRVTGKRHLFDPYIGAFNRHDDGTKGDAFLEAGGVLVETLCWLAKKKGDRSLVENAQRIAHFSYAFRDFKTTGLVENQPTEVRWDKYVSTTEVGLWAGDLLRAADLSDEADFAHIADAAMTAYLKYGYDAQAGEYYGQINVKDGKPPVIKPVDNAGGKLDGNYRHKADGTVSPDGDYPAPFRQYLERAVSIPRLPDGLRGNLRGAVPPHQSAAVSRSRGPVGRCGEETPSANDGPGRKGRIRRNVWTRHPVSDRLPARLLTTRSTPRRPASSRMPPSTRCSLTACFAATPAKTAMTPWMASATCCWR